jgi:hypothetical protein
MGLIQKRTQGRGKERRWEVKGGGGGRRRTNGSVKLGDEDGVVVGVSVSEGGPDGSELLAVGGYEGMA